MTATSLNSGEVRDLLLRALHHDAVEDAVTEVLFEHVVGGRYERSEVAALLRLKVQDVQHAATGEDWEAIAEAYVADDGDLDPDALGGSGAGRVHEFDGTRFDVGLVRGFLASVLVDPASADGIAEATTRAGGPEAPASAIAEELRSVAACVLRAANEEDWNAVTHQLIAQAREIDAEGRLGFYDLQRQRYAEANPIREAGEFQIGDYGEDGSPGRGGEQDIQQDDEGPLMGEMYQLLRRVTVTPTLRSPSRRSTCHWEGGKPDRPALPDRSPWAPRMGSAECVPTGRTSYAAGFPRF
jgi:hypothetical protein